MPTYFFDTSALAKYYIREQGSAWVIATIDDVSTSSDIIVAGITYAEMVATFARLTREGRMAQVDGQVLATAALRHFQLRKYQRRAISWQVIEEAGHLALTHAQAGQGLRGYDAVQLACAELENQRLRLLGQSPLTFVTADHRLFQIAVMIGLIVIDPATQPQPK